MAGAKQNKLASRLQELNEIPQGYRFDAAAVWDRMEGELPRQKKAFLPWLAAAAVLLLLLGALWLRTNGPADDRDTPLVRKQVPSAPSPKQASPALPSIHSITATETGGERPRLVPHSAQQVPASQPLSPDTVAAQLATTILPPESTVDTSVIVAAPLPKTKFRVVHINELEGKKLHNAAPPALAQQQRKPRFATVTEGTPDFDDKSIFNKKKPFLSPIASQ